MFGEMAAFVPLHSPHVATKICHRLRRHLRRRFRLRRRFHLRHRRYISSMYKTTYLRGGDSKQLIFVTCQFCDGVLQLCCYILSMHKKNTKKVVMTTFSVFFLCIEKM
jgi:hypothetical protein